jgi:hypothetical protein
MLALAAAIGIGRFAFTPVLPMMQRDAGLSLQAGPLSARVPYRTLWVAGEFAMAAGVALPALWSGTTAIVLCALGVGGTFMVVTMAGMQEARRVAPEHATARMAAMTAAFAGRQIVGPVLVRLAAGHAHGMALCLLAASTALGTSALLLAWDRAGGQGRSVAE